MTRIVEGALELLNRADGGAVTTNHIAAHLGMSPGNLYYHFRNREEIVRAIFPRIDGRGARRDRGRRRRELGAREFGERHLQGLHTLWQLSLLLPRPEPARRARSAARRGVPALPARACAAQYRGIFEQLIAQGSMRAPEPADDLERLVTNSILIWVELDRRT